MSAEATFWAWKLNIDSPLAKLVLLRLADRAGEDQECWPAMSSVARETGMSLSSVKRHIGKLVELGHLIVSNQMRMDGSKTSNRYLLNVAGGGSERPEVGSGRAMGDGSERPEVGSGRANMNLPLNLPVSEPIPHTPSAPAVVDGVELKTEAEPLELSTRDQSAEGAIPTQEVSPRPLPGIDLPVVSSGGNRAVKAKLASDPRHKIVIGLYTAAFEAKFGFKYSGSWAADAAGVSKMLKASPELDAFQIVGIIQCAWLSSNHYHKSVSQKLRGCAAAWNDLRIAYQSRCSVPTPDLKDPHAF